MKISQFEPIGSSRRDVEIPLAVAGENRKITLGQIIDAVPNPIVTFKRVESAPAGTVIANTEGPALLGSVVFDTDTSRFYLSALSGSVAEGFVTTYYTSWPGSANFYDGQGNIRSDCFFLSLSSGQIFFFDGGSLKSAGGQKAEVISLEEYDALGSPDPDTIYYIYEDE